MVYYDNGLRSTVPRKTEGVGQMTSYLSLVPSV